MTNEVYQRFLEAAVEEASEWVATCSVTELMEFATDRYANELLEEMIAEEEKKVQESMREAHEDLMDKLPDYFLGC